MTALDALERLIESAVLEHKDTQLAPLEARLRQALANAWRKQGRVFLHKLELVSADFGVSEARRLREAIGDDWPAYWDQTADETVDDLAIPLDDATKQALLTGGVSLIADMGLDDQTWDLANPRAVAYMDQHGAALVGQLNDVTRERLQRVLAGGLEDGLSYSKLAAQIRMLFDGFDVYRSQMVAVTELASAYEAGSAAVIASLIEQGLEYQKSWLLAPNACDICEPNQGDGWISVDDSFSSGDDLPPAHPNCLPGFVPIQAHGIEAATKRLYDGDLVVIRTAAGRELACTPNHPVLTDGGWRPAGLLDEANHVVSCQLAQRVAPAHVNDQDVPTRIEDVTETLGRSKQMTARPVPVAAEDFHGDGLGSEVAVVWTDRLLGNRRDATRGQHVGQERLAGVEHGAGLDGGGDLLAMSGRVGGAAYRGMRGGNLRAALGRGHGPPFQRLGVTLGAQLDSGSEQPLGDRRASHAEGLREGQDRLAGDVAIHEIRGRLPAAVGATLDAVAWPDAARPQVSADGGLSDAVLSRQLHDGGAVEITLDQIVAVSRTPFRGHVYNLQTAAEWYLAAGIVTHNCRCTTLYQRVDSAGNASDHGEEG